MAMTETNLEMEDWGGYDIWWLVHNASMGGTPRWRTAQFGGKSSATLASKQTVFLQPSEPCKLLFSNSNVELWQFELHTSPCFVERAMGKPKLSKGAGKRARSSSEEEVSLSSLGCWETVLLINSSFSSVRQYSELTFLSGKRPGSANHKKLLQQGMWQ